MPIATPTLLHPSSAHDPMPRRRASDAPDAITFLIADHQKMTRMFKQYHQRAEAHAPAAEREALAARLCHELVIHMQIEDEIFYPAARDANVNKGEIDEATVEHQTARDLIRQIQSMHGDDALYDAKVKVLSEYVEHHIHEEQDDLFPMCPGRMNVQAVGAALQQRKAELMAGVTN